MINKFINRVNMRNEDSDFFCSWIITITSLRTAASAEFSFKVLRKRSREYPMKKPIFHYYVKIRVVTKIFGRSLEDPCHITINGLYLKIGIVCKYFIYKRPSLF